DPGFVAQLAQPPIVAVPDHPKGLIKHKFRFSGLQLAFGKLCPESIGHGNFIKFPVSATALLRPQANSAFVEIHLAPLDAEDFRLPASRKEGGQEHEPLIFVSSVQYRFEIRKRRDIAGVPLFRELVDQLKRVDPIHIVVLGSPVPCGDEILAVLVCRVAVLSPVQLAQMIQRNGGAYLTNRHFRPDAVSKQPPEGPTF
ncbi:hypothetical protein, partial [Salidesulfovibrio brasiliensis]